MKNSDKDYQIEDEEGNFWNVGRNGILVGNPRNLA